MKAIARILKSNGTDGCMLISSPEVDFEQIEGPVFVKFDGLPVPFFVEDCRQRGVCKYVVHMTGVLDLKDSEEMTGREILIEESALGEDFSGDEGLEDFIGWTVVDATRGETVLGTVEDFEPIAGNPCLYIRTADGQQIMVPLHEDFMAGADPAARTMTLRLPEGLY